MSNTGTHSQEELFTKYEALTFDDVLIVPGYTEVLPNETDIGTQLTEEIHLAIPIISAAMDTVTESPMAIALAREGGLGIIHRNLSPEDQAAEVAKVKRSQSGMIVDPITLPPTATLREAEEIMSTYHISGVPITEADNHLIGILTNRDFRFVDPKDYDRPVTEFMTSEDLISAPVDIDIEDAKSLLHRHRIEKLVLVDDHFILKGLITVKDIQKARDFPDATSDSQGRLVVGAAVGVGADLEERITLMRRAGLDIVVIDTAHGHSAGVLKAIRRIKAIDAGLPVIAGNVVTAEGARALIEAGADIIKVGVGAGSICTTRIVSGAGLPQITAIHDCAGVAADHGVPLIADGGIKYSGDVVKAIAAGAHIVMLGSMLAGMDEAPGEVVFYDGRRYKEYRGMGSIGAMRGYGRDRYGSGQSGSGKLVPEGVEARVPYKGPLHDYVFQLVGGLRSGLGYAGAANLDELRAKARFTRITNAGLIESHPHSVTITQEPPNYQIG
ncbi:MAG: IMP dehydrogenase [Anaerolineae bacterium]|nr:IMP dehydrogenase [Anaerolineae bacterium]